MHVLAVMDKDAMDLCVHVPAFLLSRSLLVSGTHISLHDGSLKFLRATPTSPATHRNLILPPAKSHVFSNYTETEYDNWAKSPSHPTV